LDLRCKWLFWSLVSGCLVIFASITHFYLFLFLSIEQPKLAIKYGVTLLLSFLSLLAFRLQVYIRVIIWISYTLHSYVFSLIQPFFIELILFLESHLIKSIFFSFITLLVDKSAGLSRLFCFLWFVLVWLWKNAYIWFI
jgi:hypothetical protein